MTGKAALIPALAFLVSGCLALDYPPMAFKVDRGMIVAAGAVDRSSIRAFNDIAAENPGIKTLVLQIVDGSADDEANLALGRIIRRAGFTTIVPSDGLVASGGTDLFLAGAVRVLEEGACVGVHSWSDGVFDGASTPRTSFHHAPYLEYYQFMGIPEGFYWFTLERAPASGMHWMNQGEADGFGMTTNPSPYLGPSNECDRR